MKKLVFKFFYRIFILSSLLMVTFFLFGCGIMGKAVYESSQKPEIYFCPKDNCGNVLAKNILNASSSVYCALYDLDLKNVIAALTNKSGKIEVKIVIDNDNNDNLIKGENARFDDNKQLMHNKFCINCLLSSNLAFSPFIKLSLLSLSITIFTSIFPLLFVRAAMTFFKSRS